MTTLGWILMVIGIVITGLSTFWDNGWVTIISTLCCVCAFLFCRDTSAQQLEIALLVASIGLEIILLSMNCLQDSDHEELMPTITLLIIVITLIHIFYGPAKLVEAYKSQQQNIVVEETMQENNTPILNISEVVDL